MGGALASKLSVDEVSRTMDVCRDSIARDRTDLKPPIIGLIAMGNTAFRHRAGEPDVIGDLEELPGGIFDAAVINVTWAQLEPEKSALRAHVVERALAWIHDYNHHHTDHPLAARLRVWPGSSAPDWAKSLGGPPLTVEARTGYRTIGRFWAEPYRGAWRSILDRLALHYDAHPLIRDISVSSCSSLSDEPFIDATTPGSLAIMHDAGLTDAAYEACLIEAVGDYSAWQNTRLVFPFNPLRRTDSGELVRDLTFTLDLMKSCRQALGERLIVSNHDLTIPEFDDLEDLFAAMRTVGPPIDLQLFSPNIDTSAAVKRGIERGATTIEIWNRTIPELAIEEMRQWSASLKQNFGQWLDRRGKQKASAATYNEENQ
jgi:hypothetical protein